MKQGHSCPERNPRNGSRLGWSNCAASAWRDLLAVTAVVIGLAGGASAQTSAGRIIGTITDPQGATIAGAKVTVSNTATNVTWTTTTDGAGGYQVLDLPIGMYSVTLEIQGFNKVVTQPQELSINQSLRIDLRLKVGVVSEVVDVHSQASQVETVDPTIGGTISGEPLQSLPLNGRETLDLALTQPGVAPAPDTGYGSEKSGSFESGFTVAGGRPDSITYLLDGGLNNSVTSGNVIFDPNPDAVAEFRILSNNYTAEYGRSGGGTVSVVTKSGSNDWHGSIFEFLRNDAFNANNYFSNENGEPRQILKRSQYGGTLGGPVVKDKLFFFFAYQGQRQVAITNEGKLTTFTPAELDLTTMTANFSNDPLVTAFVSPGGGGSYFEATGANGGPGVIDLTKIDPVASAYIAANLIPVSPTGTIFQPARGTDNANQYTGKVDWYASRNDRLSLTLGSNSENVLSPFSLSQLPNTTGFPETDSNTNRVLNLSYLKTISSIWLSETHLNASRYHSVEATASATPPTLGSGTFPAGLASAGFSSGNGTNLFSDDPTGPPLLTFSNGLNIGFDPNAPRTKAENIFAGTETMTWVRGKHSWKAGVRFGILQENSVYVTDGNGAFDFDTYTTPGIFEIGSGNALADFLLGAPDLFIQFSKASNNEHQKQWSGFVQDEWRALPRLVLTLGVRYEYTSPEKDTHGHSFSFIPSLTDTIFGGAAAGFPPGLVVPGDKGAPNGWYWPDWTNVAPRFGFAWDPFGKGKLSVRGGVGMFYDQINGWMSDWNDGNPPWYAGTVQSYINPINNGPGNQLLSNPYSIFGLTDPFPSHVSVPGTDTLAGQGATFPYGSGIAYVDPNLKTPYIYQYDLSVQGQLPNGFVAEVGYVGSSSHKLLSFIDVNPINPNAKIDPVTLLPERILTQQLGLSDGSGSAPNNEYASMINFANKANANYNGMLASLTKNASPVPHLGQMFFSLSYTWSHNLDNASGFNQRSAQVPYYNPHQFYSNSDFDQRQRLAFSGGWDLPFAEMWTGAPKGLVKGWSLYPVAFYQSGIPIDLYLNPSYQVPPSPFTAGTSGYGDPELSRPDQLTPTVQTFDPHQVQTYTNPATGVKETGNFYFNPNDFQTPPCLATASCPTGYYGSFQRNSFVGPSRVNFDLALEKATDIGGERTKLMFRVEAFNIFNHTEFKSPGSQNGGNFSSGTLGQVTTAYDPRILQLSLRLSF